MNVLLERPTIETVTSSVPAPAVLRRASVLQWITVVHGLVEGSAALIASHGAQSVALLGFGLDSIIEVCSASIVLWRIASLKGSGKLHISEHTGLRLVGTGFLVLAASISTDAIRSLLGHEVPKESWLGIVVAGVSVLMMPILGRMKKRLGGEIHSPSMQADAKQTHFCAYLAGITLIGLGLNAACGWWWADSVAALCMAPIIGWEGIRSWHGRACGCCASDV